MRLTAAFEGATDGPIVEKLAADAGFEVLALPAHGKGNLDPKLRGYAAAAKGSPWFVLRDLDRDAACAPALVAKLGLPTAPWLSLCIAVRSLEAWLLADRAAVARALVISVGDVPLNPDAERDPKATLIGLARKSKRPSIIKGMVPARGHKTRVGPEYTRIVTDLGREDWSLDRAARVSTSLARARRSLRDLAARWHAQTTPATSSATTSPRRRTSP